MSSPNHPTFDIEDAFSSNSLNYTSASPDYSPASPGNTPYESSNNSFILVPIASPTLLLFHDDPYMKVMHAYYGKELPIPPLIIVPPSLMLSAIFNPQEFFVPEELLPPKEQVNYLTSSSTDLSNPSRKQASPAMNQAVIRQLIDNHVATALEAQAANMANTDNTNRNPEPRETLAARKLFSRSNCTKECKVKFDTSTLTEDALSWWNSYATPIGIEQADKIAWSKLKRLLTNKYCPRIEVKKMEDKFYNLTVKGNNLKTYARRFQELAVLYPNMVPNTEKLMEVFIGGLPRSIEGNVTASKPQTLEEAINISQRLMDQVLKQNPVQETNDHK
uniref:Reverse transcriptase domain-containing protein n=1 Tax=Tanacetum cinerariifolium TaxID=118510 RepID=A0A699GQ34_TANCI|nr:reverse transcriptase domain-containing protein [Tanacetum cinerariifolium]